MAQRRGEKVNLKPLGRKAYGSIPHLPGSRLGPGDHHCHEGQAAIACQKTRDQYDRIIVTEKLDGSCVAAAKLAGQILSLGRGGYLAQSSKYKQHQLWAAWVRLNASRFRALLRDGEWAAGEWLAQAHGTRYTLLHEPFVMFDLFRNERRISHDELHQLTQLYEFTCPFVVSDGPPLSIGSVQDLIKISHHGALDPVEGAVWRVERNGIFDFMCKWLRPDKKDGRYLPEISGKKGIWNWKPNMGVL